MANELEKDIDSVATELEKSTKTPMERVIETIKKLGPAGIRAKLPTLEKSQKELLISALGEMKKAVEMDANYQAKFVQGKITDTKIQEDKADDDQDEKLVMQAAAVQNHQGTPTDGWEGQVIKGKKPEKNGDEKKEKQMGEKMKDAVEEVAENEAKEEVKDHEGKMHAAKKKVKSGKADKMKEGLKEMKKALEEKLGSTDAALIKGEMKKLLAEESQEGDAPEMNEKTRANKESVPAIELGKDNKKNMTKSAVWGGENDLLKANTQGRNFHFSLEEYINQVSNAKPVEEVKKGFTEKKEDLNDIIEKGGDTTWGEIETNALVKGAKRTGTVTKSFADNEIAQALGLTEEEAKKILGE